MKSPEEPTLSLRSLERWLLAVQFIVRAEDAAAQGAPADHTAAVILADTATESILALLAGLPGGNPTNDSFPQLRDAAFRAIASAHVPAPAHLAQTVITGHERRNSAIHHGVESGESETTIESARRLLALLPAVSALFPDVPRGAGLLGAVAALVDKSTDVASRLRSADKQLRAGDMTIAADEGAIALAVAITQSSPAIMPRHGRRFRTNRETDDMARVIFERLQRLDAWVVPMALGLRPPAYQAMTTTLGQALLYANGKWRVHRDPDPPEPAKVRGSLDLLAEVIVRLWATGSLYRGTAEEAILDAVERDRG